MEGSLLDETLDVVHRMADERSHAGELRTTFEEIASEVGADPYRVITALHDLRRRGAFLQVALFGGTPAGKAAVVTRRNPEGTDARGMLLGVLTRMADDLSRVDATAEELRSQLPYLKLDYDDVKMMIRMLEAEGEIEDLLRLGGPAGPDHKFMIRLL